MKGADVKRYEPALRAYLSRRFPSLPDHDDVVQETYIQVLRARETGRLTYAKACLFTAARNVAIDIFRRRRNVTHESISDLVELPVLDTALGDRKIGGVIALDQVEAFVRLLEQDGDTAVERRSAGVIALRRVR